MFKTILVPLDGSKHADFRSMVFGSITERLLLATRRPILLVRPAEPAGQASLGEGRHQTAGSVVLP